jgi:hypothetical protein
VLFMEESLKFPLPIGTLIILEMKENLKAVTLRPAAIDT